MGIRLFVRIASIAILFSPGVLSQPKTFYTITALGTFGGAGSQVSAINAKGQVVGFADMARQDPWRGGYLSHAFLYDHSLHDLGRWRTGGSRAYGINDRGDVVGDFDPAKYRFWPFVYRWGLMLPMLVFPLEGVITGTAYDINNSGSITGILDPPSICCRPFIRQKGITSIIPGGQGSGTRINERNHIAGYVVEPGPGFRAFYYDGETHVFGKMGEFSRSLGLNDQDFVVGGTSGWLADDVYVMRAFLYHEGVVTELASLEVHSEAQGINNRGEIVGWTAESVETGAPRRGVIWKSGTPYDLNDLLEANSRGNWIITEARDINDSGQIAAQGYSPELGVQALRLDPSK